MSEEKVNLLIEEMKKSFVNNCFSEETLHGWWVNTDEFFTEVKNLLLNSEKN